MRQVRTHHRVRRLSPDSEHGSPLDHSTNTGSLDASECFTPAAIVLCLLRRCNALDPVHAGVAELQLRLDEAGAARDAAAKDLAARSAERDRAQERLEQLTAEGDTAHRQLEQLTAERDAAREEAEQRSAEAQRQLESAAAEREGLQQKHAAGMCSPLCQHTKLTSSSPA